MTHAQGAMPGAIQVVADLRALNQWAQESRIASEAEDPRRAPHSARSLQSASSEQLGVRSTHSERLSESKSLSEELRSSFTSDRMSMVRSSRLESEGRSRDSRSSTRKGTLDLPRSSSRNSTSPSMAPSRPSALMDIPASDPLSSLPKLLRQISTTTDAESEAAPSTCDLALQNTTNSTSRATATYANNQFVVIPQDCAARQTPKTRKMKADLLRTHPWLQELQRAAQSGSLPGSPANRLQPPEALSTPNLPPLDTNVSRQ